MIGLHGQLPNLELLAANTDGALCKGDFIKEPIGSGLVGNELCAIGEQHITDKGVPIPMFASGKLLKIGFAESRGFVSLLALGYEVQPRAVPLPVGETG